MLVALLVCVTNLAFNHNYSISKMELGLEVISIKEGKASARRCASKTNGGPRKLLTGVGTCTEQKKFLRRVPRLVE